MTYINIIKMFLLLPIIVTGTYLANVYNKMQQPIPKEPVKVAKVVDQKQLSCLADNIYYEAGSEITEGKAAVARVVLNRINNGGFGSTPCKVVYQMTQVKQINTDTEEPFWIKVCQFSWVCEGKGNPNKRDPRYQKSLQVAYDVLAYDAYKDIIPRSVLYFHNTSITPEWPHEVVKKIGNHIFYRKSHKHGHNQTHKYNTVTTTQSFPEEKV